MIKFYGVHLIKKTAYEQLDSLKDKLKRIIKHPGLGSSIPWAFLRLLFLITSISTGIITTVIIRKLLDSFSITVNLALLTLLELLIFTVITLFSHTYLNKKYFQPPGDVHEMNTFLVVLGEYKKWTLKNSSRNMKTLEHKVNHAIQKYHKNLLKNMVQEVRKDLDVRTFKKDYEKISRVIMTNPIGNDEKIPVKLDSWHEDLLHWTRNTYSYLLRQNNFWIWHDTKEKEAIVIFPRLHEIPESFKQLPNTKEKFNMKMNTIIPCSSSETILHALDEITLISFFIHQHIVSHEPIISISQSIDAVQNAISEWNQTITKHANNTDDENELVEDMDMIDFSLQEPLADIILLMINKLSGSAEVFLQQARQKNHMIRLVQSTQKGTETDAPAQFIKSIVDSQLTMLDKVLEEGMAHVNELHQLATQLINLSMELRTHQFIVKRLKLTDLKNNSEMQEALLQLLHDFTPFYKELEKIRFLTQWFEDMEHFTLLKEGIAIESGTEQISPEEIPNDVILLARNLFKQYQGAAHTVYALRGVSLQVKKGEFLIITGPSGSGKTTLLNVLSGLDLPDRGSVILDGEDITIMSQKKLADVRREKIGFIFQYYNLLPVLNSLENVSYPREIKGELLAGRQRARKLLNDVGLERFQKQTPNKLSGGQMQRVTIARSLQNLPKIIFADEPTGDLDHVTGEQVMELLKKFHQEGHTIILVTHDLSLLKYGTRWIEMKDGQIVKELVLDDKLKKALNTQ